MSAAQPPSPIEDVAVLALQALGALVEQSPVARQVRIGFSLLDGRRYVLDTGARPALSAGEGPTEAEVLCNAVGLIGLLENTLVDGSDQVFLGRGDPQALSALAELLAAEVQLGWGAD